MKKNKALKEYIYRKPLLGSKLALLGALVMFLWAGWECLLRYDAMDGMTMAYMNLVKNNSIPLREAVETIWNTPEARQDWLNLIVLSSIAVFGLFTFFFSRFWKPGILVIPVCILIMFYHTSDSMIVRTLNLFEAVKLASAGAVVCGETLNIYSALQRKHRYKKQLAQKHRSTRLLSEPGAKKKSLSKQRHAEIDM